MKRLSLAVALATLAPTGLAQTTWYVDGTHCTGFGTGSESDPFCTIQEGVDASSVGDQIYVRAGVYVESVMVGGKSISLICIDGPHTTILRSSSAGVDPTLPAVDVRAGGTFFARRLTVRESRPGILAMDAAVVLEGCELIDNFNEDSGGGNGGAALHAQRAHIELTKCTIAHGRGGFAVRATDGMLRLKGSTIKPGASTCCSGFGGALYLDGGDLDLVDTSVIGMDACTTDAPVQARNAEVYVQGCEFAEGYACDATAAMGLRDCSFTIDATTFRDCGACQAGGVLGLGSSSGVVENSVFRDSDLDMGFSGGIFMNGGDTGSVVITNCLFEDNTGDIGGGVTCWSGELTIDGSVFRGNTARLASDPGWGGALYVDPSADVLAINCLFVGNLATNDGIIEARGGAVYGPATLRSCTLVENRAVGDPPNDGGGGCDGGTTLEDCIVWDNFPNQLENVGPVSYSDVQGGWAGTGNLDADSRFWGPAHGDYHLLSDSPCIDAGDPTRQDADGTRIDMGAYPFDAAYCGSPGNYCAAKINSLACAPSMGWSGQPTVAGADDFHVLASDVLPNQIGILMSSVAGVDEAPFFGGLRCVAAPLVRSLVLRSTATGDGECPGRFDYPLTQAEMSNRGLVAGTRLYLQFWYRDPFHADGTGIGLTDGLEVTLCAGP